MISLKNTAATAALACVLTTTTGCLVTSSSSSSYTGSHIEPGADRQVVLGETTPEGAIDILGEPSTRITDKSTGDVTLTWRWSKRTKSSGSVFLIFGGSSDTTRKSSLHVAFEDGVAARKWRD